MPFDNMSEAQRFAVRLLHKPKLWLLLAVLNIIPVLNILALGYFARVAAELPQEPPTLRPLGRAFVLGLKVLATTLVYGILTIITTVFAVIAMFSAAMPVALPVYDSSVELLIAIVAVALAVVLLAVLGVPIALIVAARHGVLAALSPLNSWRIIRRVGLGEYSAYLIVTLSFTLLSFLPATATVLFGLAGYVVALIALVLAAPLVEALLWYWGGLIVQRAESAGEQ